MRLILQPGQEGAGQEDNFGFDRPQTSCSHRRQEGDGEYHARDGRIVGRQRAKLTQKASLNSSRRINLDIVTDVISLLALHTRVLCTVENNRRHSRSGCCIAPPTAPFSRGNPVTPLRAKPELGQCAFRDLLARHRFALRDLLIWHLRALVRTGKRWQDGLAVPLGLEPVRQEAFMGIIRVDSDLWREGSQRPLGWKAGP